MRPPFHPSKFFIYSLRVVLTNALIILIKNPIKESFYEKRKKKKAIKCEPTEKY